MFGYVGINRNQLSEEDKKIYQSYYCGLCQNLKSHFGKKGQMLLNYDIVFLEILLIGLYETRDEVVNDFTCHLHPFKKRPLRKNEILDYAAHMNVLLAYHNLMDDYADEHSSMKLKMAQSLRDDYHLAAKLYPRQAKAVEDYLIKLNEFEKTYQENAKRDANRTKIDYDYVASFTGEMLGELLAMREDEWYQELKCLGMNLGKFIYLMDAYEDLPKDRKKNAFNPLMQLSENCEIEIKNQLTIYMQNCALSFERLPILLHADILRNIIYSGVWTRYEYLQVRKEKGKRK